GPSGCADGGSAPAGESEEPIGQAAQALNQVCIGIQRGAFGTVADAQIANKLPAANYGTATGMNTGLGSGQERQDLIRLELGVIPVGAKINSAIFSAYDNFAPNGQATLNVHRVLAPWNETTVTWQSFAGAFNPAVEGTVSNALNPAPVHLVSLVQGWVNG